MDDIRQSLKTCSCLGIQVIKLDGQDVIQSVPQEINSDAIHVLGLNHITLETIQNELKYSVDRAKVVLQQLLNDGILWVDEQSHPHSYYIYTGSQI